MKHLKPVVALAAAFATLMASAPGFAGNEGPQAAPMPEWAIVRLEKRTTPGFQPPSVPVQTSTCKIFSDRVELEQRVGDDVTHQKLELVFNEDVTQVADLWDLMKAADSGKIVTSEGPMDAPTTTHRIPHYRQTRGGTERAPTVLKQWGTQMIENQAPEAEKLVKFIDLNCERSARL